MAVWNYLSAHSSEFTTRVIDPFSMCTDRLFTITAAFKTFVSDRWLSNLEQHYIDCPFSIDFISTDTNILNASDFYCYYA